MRNNIDDVIKVNGIILLKTKKEERIRDLQHGDVYCKRLQYYIDLEEKQGDKIVGDAWEASLPVRDAYIYVPDKNIVEYVNDDVIHSTKVNNFVFCMTGRKMQKNERDKKLVDDEILNFGGYSLVVTNMEKFVDRLRKGAAENGFSLIKHDFVKYYDEQQDMVDMILNIKESMSNIAFWKRKRYELQSEYRFLFSGITEMDHIQFNIGDISDISVIVDTNRLIKARMKK